MICSSLNLLFLIVLLPFFSQQNSPFVTSSFSGSGQPNGKFGKFELLDTNGNVLRPTEDCGTNLLRFVSTDLVYATNLPEWATPSAGSLVAHFPQICSTNVYPHFRSGEIACQIGFVSNGPPSQLGHINLNREYSITNEGDYMLIIQPVIYSKHVASLTLNREELKALLRKGLYIAYYEKDGIVYAETNLDSPVLYRRDLPCITTKVHLVPNATR